MKEAILGALAVAWVMPIIRNDVSDCFEMQGHLGSALWRLLKGPLTLQDDKGSRATYPVYATGCAADNASSLILILSALWVHLERIRLRRIRILLLDSDPLYQIGYVKEIGTRRLSHFPIIWKWLN